jgi:hypothetical protein
VSGSVTLPFVPKAGPHHINYASEWHDDDWFIYCLMCGVGLVNKHRAKNPDELFAGHDGRPDLDIEPAAQGMPTHPIPLVYCCRSMGWVPPNVAFDHRWDDTAGWDD